MTFPSRRLAPSPPASFLTGHLGAIRRDVLGLLVTSARDHGDIVRFRIGPLTMHLINHPDWISHVLIRHRRNYDKNSRSSKNLSLICGDSLLTTNGPEWKLRRDLMQPMFHRCMVQSFVETIGACTADQLDGWQDFANKGEPIDIAAEMMKLTFRIVGRCLFGAELAREAAIVEHAMHVLVLHAYHRWRAPIALPAHWPTPANRRFRESLGEVDRIIAHLIEGHRAHPPATPDLLTMLLQGEDGETGQPLSDAHIRNEAITFLLAGHETTANALSWALYRICRHPDLAEALRTEADAAWSEGIPDLETLGRLPHTLCFFEETLRLHPPIWAMERHAVEDDEIAGYAIPKGSSVIISPYLLHRHPDHWEQPEAFDPSRFESGSRTAYLPFGAGSRFCIGSEFALTEARIILAMILRNYELIEIPGQQVVAEPAITLRIKDGFRVRLRKRHDDFSNASSAG